MRPISMSLLIVALVGSIAIAQAEQCAYSEYRLPTHIKPSHYDVEFDIDLESPTFGGSVKIDLKVNDESDKAPKNVIVLHAAPTLDVSEVHYHPNGDDKSDLVDSICRDAENEQLVVTLKESLSSGSQGSLEMLFKAEYRTDFNGIYRAVFEGQNPSGGTFVSTRFQPTQARAAFPCFDEPSFKATFDLTLNHSPKYVALANTPVKSSEIDEATKLHKTKFNTIPSMSTYVIGFVIGKFDFMEKVIGDAKLPVRVYTRPGAVEYAKFALETAVKTIGFLEDFFKVPYPLEKLDLVSMNMGDEGAMENWGLLTFGESYMLGDPKHMSPGTELQVAKTVAHELVHQWLGNLVTPKWWDDAWLNEGLATLFEIIIVDSLYPEIKILDFHRIFMHEEAMAVDIKPDAHAIKFDNLRRETMDDIFEPTIYSKSATILSYLRDEYVGPGKFAEAIRNYLQKHMYGNVEASDLWDELVAVSGKPVDSFMKSWLTQPGFPLIRASLDSRGRKLILEQERYMACSDSAEGSENQHSCQRPEPNDQTWIIPVQLTTALGWNTKYEVENHLISEKKVEIELPEWFEPSNEGHWLALNENSKGFYRVLYDNKLLKRLRKQHQPDWLNPYFRASLISDMRSNYENGLIDISKLRDSLGMFPEERNGVVLFSLAEAFDAVLNDTKDEKARSQLRKLGRRLLEPISQAVRKETKAKRVTWATEAGLELINKILEKINSTQPWRNLRLG